MNKITLTDSELIKVLESKLDTTKRKNFFSEIVNCIGYNGFDQLQEHGVITNAKQMRGLMVYKW